MFGWIKCIALIVGTISFFRWERNYKPRKVYPRDRHFCDVECF